MTNPKYAPLKRGIQIEKFHTFFKIRFRSDYVFSGESHNFWEMVFVLDGNVGITADSDVYVLQKGQAIIHRPNEFHKIWSEFGTNPTVIVVSFTASVFPEIKGRLLSFDPVQADTLSKLCDKSYTCIERNSIALYNSPILNMYEAQKLMLELELFIFSAVARRGHESPSGLKSAEIYSAAVKLMEEHIQKNYRIGDFAEMLNVSTPYLKKIFCKYSGSGVMKYYNHLKVRIACTYLDEGRSVKETSSLLGFEDQNYFSTFFKRLTGMSPSEFKKNV